MRIDEFPTHELNGVCYRYGHALPYGATAAEGGINFSINSSTATGCTLVLFHRGEKKPFIKIPFPDDFKIGDNYAMFVKDLNIEDIEYGYCFDGPYDPEKGLLFDKNRILLDPYA